MRVKEELEVSSDLLFRSPKARPEAIGNPERWIPRKLPKRAPCLTKTFRPGIALLWLEVPNSFLLTLRPSVENQLRISSVQQAIQTIRNRVDQLGVAEPVIQEHGVASEYQILVQLPGVDDPARVERHHQINCFVGTEDCGTRLRPVCLASGRAQPIRWDGPGREGAASVSQKIQRCLSTERRMVFGQQSGCDYGADLRTARESSDEFGKPGVSFNLTADGAARFGRVTEENIGKQLAIVLDGKVQSAPRINGRITDSGQITGSFTHEQANDLALILRSGALPARMIYPEERTVGASLGADSIRHGVIASLVGLASRNPGHVVLLQAVGRERDCRSPLKPDYLGGLPRLHSGHTDFAGDCRGRALNRYGGGFKRSHFRAYSGRVMERKERCPQRLTQAFPKRSSLSLTPTSPPVVSVLFLFIFGTGPVKGICRCSLLGIAGQSLHLGFCLQGAFRFRARRIFPS